MDVVEAILLFVGMALIGVRLLGLLNPLIAAVLTRTLSETSWDGAMLLWAQGSAALVTLWLGIEMGGPWWAAVIVALLVAVTTFATRRPSHDHSVRSDELGRQVCVCPAGQTPRTGWR